MLAYTLSGFFKNWGMPPENAIALWSVLAGVLFLGAAGKIAGLLGRDRREEWHYPGPAGHRQHPALVWAHRKLQPAGVALALAHCADGFPSGPWGWWPGPLALHPQAAFAFGGCWFDGLVALRRKLAALAAPRHGTGPQWGHRARLDRGDHAGSGRPLPGGGGGAAGVPGGETQLFWMPWEALAPARLWDALVNLWLVAPLLPPDRRHHHGPAPPRLRQDRTFASPLASLGMLAFHFTFQNELPRPRDWDLFAIVGPTITLWGLYGMANGEWRMANGPILPIPTPHLAHLRPRLHPRLGGGEPSSPSWTRTRLTRPGLTGAGGGSGRVGPAQQPVAGRPAIFLADGEQSPWPDLPAQPLFCGYAPGCGRVSLASSYASSPAKVPPWSGKAPAGGCAPASGCHARPDRRHHPQHQRRRRAMGHPLDSGRDAPFVGAVMAGATIFPE